MMDVIMHLSIIMEDSNAFYQQSPQKPQILISFIYIVKVFYKIRNW